MHVPSTWLMNLFLLTFIQWVEDLSNVTALPQARLCGRWSWRLHPCLTHHKHWNSAACSVWFLELPLLCSGSDQVVSSKHPQAMVCELA